MTLVGLFGLWLATKLLDAFVDSAGFGDGTAPAPGPTPTPRRGPFPGRRRNRPPPFVPGVPDEARPTPAPTPTPNRPTTGPVNPAVAPGEVFTPPWPQVVPAGLPPFPGAGWEPDNPPPSAVVQRAFSLLNPLWQGGPGTFKVEKTGARWIAYQAQQMGAKKGVVAFRQRGVSAASSPSSPSSPTIVPAGGNVGLPTLRRGSRGEEVRILQRKLGIDADGAFGPGTESAVRAFQRSRGLDPDGVVGPQTWAALVGRAAA